MLCKKCKTAVLQEDKICGYCGASVRKMNMLSYFFVVMAAFIIFIFFSFSERFINPETPVEVTVSEIPDPNIEYVGSTNTARPTPTPFAAFDSGENLDWVIDMTENIALAAYNYVKAGINYVYYLSKNGYLYDDVNSKYITPSDLIEIEGFDSQYAEENVLILYLLTNEFTMTAEEDGDRLRVLCAYETVKGFYLASSQGYFGIISREALRDLLNKYSQNNGEIIRFASASIESRKIITAIQRYTNIKDNLTVRYMAGDDIHAFAAVSFGNHDSVIKEYALIRENGIWSVFAADFEARYDYRSIVNTIHPNFNPDLFPSYNMYFHNNYIRKNFDVIIYELVKREYIPQGSKPSYASGNDQFSYLEFASGRKILCYTPYNTEMSFYPISNYTEGESLMRVLSQDPPYYILKQD